MPIASDASKEAEHIGSRWPSIIQTYTNSARDSRMNSDTRSSGVEEEITRHSESCSKLGSNET
jgi:hypothetical protein